MGSALEASWNASVEAEQSVLGGLLLDNAAHVHVAKILRDDDFYTEDHVSIYRAIAALITEGSPADVVIVGDRLARQDPTCYQAMGGLAYLAALAQSTPSAVNICRYAEIVRERALCRRLDAFGAELQLLARSPQNSDALQSAIAGANGRLRTLGDLVRPGRGIQAYGADDFLNMKLPELEVLLEPWLVQKNIALLHAWRGIGKTHVALGVSFAIAGGLSFLAWRAPKPRGVLYVDGEMPAQIMQRRIRQLADCLGNGKVPQLLRILTPDIQDRAMPDLGTVAGQNEIDGLVSAETALIVIDNLSCLVRSGGAENEAESWGPIAEWALKHRRAGRAILFVHHAGKNGEQRGTSRREDVLDISINLRRPPQYREAEGAAFIVDFKKGRSITGEDIAPIEARLEPGPEGVLTWTWKQAASADRGRIRELWEIEGMTLIDVAREVGCDKSTAARALQKAMSAGELVRPYPSRQRRRPA